MDENKNTFEVPTCTVLTLAVSDAAAASRTGWDTHKFEIPDLNDGT